VTETKPTYLLTRWSLFARNGRHYRAVIESGQGIAITVNSRIFALLIPYDGRTIRLRNETNEPTTKHRESTN